jgi:hypothetical protein
VSGHVAPTLNHMDLLDEQARRYQDRIDELEHEVREYRLRAEYAERMFNKITAGLEQHMRWRGISA